MLQVQDVLQVPEVLQVQDVLQVPEVLQVPDVLIDSGYTVGFGCADFNGQTKGFAS